MSDYIINFTDGSKTPFIIKPYTTNGPLSPANTLPLHPFATSANTSLTLLGKGMQNYGEVVAEDMVRSLEHFANPSAPAYPIEGQCWYKNDTVEFFVYDGASWQPLLINGQITQDLDMNGFNIVNVGDAVLPTDALNIQTADTLYVLKIGDTITGSLTLTGGASHVNLPNAPVDPENAANKDYVDNEIIALAATLDGMHVMKTGDTMTGNLTISSGGLTISSGTTTLSGTIDLTGNTNLVDSIFRLVGPTAVINMDSHFIRNLPDPILSLDAVNKNYVDSLVFSGVSGALVSGELEQGTSTLILQVSSMPDVEVPMVSRASRYLYVSDGIEAIVNMPFTFIKGHHRLQVYQQGVKQYASETAAAVIGISTSVTIESDSGLSPSTSYFFDITVDGVLYPDVEVTTTANDPVVYNELLQLINDEFVNLTIPAVAVFFNNTIEIHSNLTGVGSEVTVEPPSTASPYIITEMPNAIAPVNNTIAVDYSYNELGNTFQNSSSVEFNTIPPLNTVIEFINTSI